MFSKELRRLIKEQNKSKGNRQPREIITILTNKPFSKILNDKKRAIFILHSFAGYSKKKLNSIFNLSYNTITSSISIGYKHYPKVKKLHF